ncbi:MAG: hypothetical protein QNJ68_18900 [Microcoleaceae cyanobacterium MO_207.B10]|nr:hypothetical protein [Microcoleaceae cyanobacterium MO_207.B10]
MNRSHNLLLLIVLILVFGGLALFGLQNWSPNVSLSFLGLRSLPLPLSIWILAALLAGIVTYLLIYSIFGLSNYLFQKNTQPRRPRTGKSVNHEDEIWEDGDRPSNARPSNGPLDDRVATGKGGFNLNKNSKPIEKNQNGDDWEKGPPKVNPSWDNEPNEEDFQDGEDFPAQSPTDQNYEVKQQPKTESWSGSVYSYGYKEPSGSGVGQTESVYDADYRVITPPPPPPSDITIPTDNQNEQNQELKEAEDSEDKSGHQQ